MSALTKVQLGLTLIGLILFFYGVRVDDERLRLIAIGFVAAASILRFAKRRAPNAPPVEPPAD